MKFGIALCLPLLLVLPGAAQTVQVDWVRGTDFGQFHTFTWATGPYRIQDPSASLAMAEAVHDELVARGVEYVDPKQSFDTFVTYNARITPDPQSSSRQVLTLTVRIFAAQNNMVVWTAGGYAPLVDDKEQNRRNARELIAAMFRQYPPS